MNYSHKIKYENMIYYITACLLPNIFLFFQFNQNRVGNIFVVSHVLILAGIFAIAGLLALIVFKHATGSIEGAFLLSIFSWLCFWLFQSILGLLSRVLPITRHYVVLLIIGICIVAITIIIRRFKPPFAKIKPLFQILTLSVLILFVMNLIPGISHMITLYQGRRAADEDSYSIREEFIIDSNLPSPDIFWLHVDGMLSLKTIEKYWDWDFDFFRDELTERGFLIYENASLNTGATALALPALLSPEFYDSFYGELLKSTERYLRDAKFSTIEEELAKVGLDYYWDLVPYFELFNAFLSRGYSIEIINNLHGKLPWTFEHLKTPNYFLGLWHSSRFADLPVLLELTTPIKMSYFLTYYRFSNDYMQLDSEDESLANFNWLSINWMSHYYSTSPVYWQGGYIMEAPYPSNIEENISWFLEIIDEYIENNPNTVIVLQADHGIHIDLFQVHLLDRGYTLDEVLKLYHSVFSAVRIPQEYGGLDAPIAPLNITRELVNRFVGKNYELLP